MFPNGVSLPRSVTTVREACDYSSQIELLESSLGRIALAICADCIAPDHTSIKSTLTSVRPDLLIVVSLTPETDPFERLMDELAEHGISSLLVNASLFARSDRNAFLALATWGFGQPPDAPPVRYGWRVGADAPERRSFHGTIEQRSWQKLSAEEQETAGVRLARHTNSPLGLLLDLLHQDL